MSSIERILAPVSHKQREELTDLNNQLRALKEQYLGQRDPMYIAQRSGLLDKRIEVQSAQSRTKRLLRQNNAKSQK